MMKNLTMKAFLQKANLLYEYLMDKIHLSAIERDDLKITEYIIGEILDNDGYLRRELNLW